MQNTNTTKPSFILGPSNNEQTEPSESNLRTLTTEEILNVAGGPEVEVGTGQD